MGSATGPGTLTSVESNEPREKRPDEQPPTPGDRTVSIWEYLEKDEAAGGKTYRGSHRVEDKEQ
jgi:hypothetical protein